MERILCVFLATGLGLGCSNERAGASGGRVAADAGSGQSRDALGAEDVARPPQSDAQILADSGAGQGADADAAAPPTEDAGPPPVVYEDNLEALGWRTAMDAEVLSVTLANERAYVCTYLQGIFVYDLRNPRNVRFEYPSEFGASEGVLLELPRCHHIAVQGDRVYATRTRGPFGALPALSALDFSEPAQPRMLSTMRGDEGRWEGLVVHREHLLVAATGAGLISVALEAGGGLTRVGESPEFAGAMRLALAGDVALVAAGHQGLLTADVSDPRAPALWGTGVTGGFARDVALMPGGQTALVAAGSAGLQLWDISEPREPRLVGAAATPGMAVSVAYGVGHAYVADWNDVRVFDLADPAAPRLVAVEDVHSEGPFARPVGVAAEGDLVAVAEWNGLAALRMHPGLMVPELTVFPSPLDFTRLLPGDELSRVVIASNTGAAPLRLDGGIVFTTAPAGARVFRAEAPRGTLQPGEQAVVELWATAEGTGPQRGLLRLFSNDPDEGTFELELRANDPGSEVGQPVPEFRLPDLDGALHGSADHLGEVVFLAFFSSW